MHRSLVSLYRSAILSRRICQFSHNAIKILVLIRPVGPPYSYSCIIGCVHPLFHSIWEIRGLFLHIVISVTTAIPFGRSCYRVNIPPLLLDRRTPRFSGGTCKYVGSSLWIQKRISCMLSSICGLVVVWHT